MNEGYQILVVLLLIGIFTTLVIVAWEVGDPTGFHNAIDKLNQPGPNIIDAIQQSAQQMSEGDKATARMVYGTMFGGLIIMGIIGVVIYVAGKLPSNANQEKEE